MCAWGGDSGHTHERSLWCCEDLGKFGFSLDGPPSKFIGWTVRKEGIRWKSTRGPAAAVSPRNNDA